MLLDLMLGPRQVLSVAKLLALAIGTADNNVLNKNAVSIGVEVTI